MREGEAKTRGQANASVPAEPAKSAPPAVDLAALTEELIVCDGDDGGHPLGDVAGAEELAQSGDGQAFLARMTRGGDERVLLFRGDAVYGCGAFVVDAPAAKTGGDWFGDGRSREVELLSQDDDGLPCDDDACPIALIVREGDTIVTAIRPGLDCATATLAPVKLFDDRDSLELHCVPPDGTDSVETLWIGHAFDRVMRPVLTADVSLTEVSPSKRPDTVCTRRWKGAWRIVGAGETPVVEVIEVDFEALGKGSKATWTYAAAERRFRRGAVEVVELASKRVCE